MSLKYEVYYDTISNFLDYRRHGEDHRSDGPASVWDDGDLWWYQYDRSHRLDGPAEIFNGRMAYYIRGVEHSQRKHNHESKIRNNNISK